MARNRAADALAVNDYAAATTSLRQALQGLPQRLVADGLVTEAAMLEAIATAKERRVAVVSYLVEHNLADPREIAISAAQEFGVPLMDLDAIQPDLETVRLVSEKILRKHRVLPLVKRGKRLFVAVSDPTNLHSWTRSSSPPAIPSRRSSSRRTSSPSSSPRRSSRSTPRCPSSRTKTSRWKPRRTAGEEAIAGDIGEGADVDDAPIVRFVNQVMLDAIRRGASDIHFEPYERIYRIRLRLDGVLKESPRRRSSSPASSPPGSRSCPGSTSPSGASPRTAASR